MRHHLLCIEFFIMNSVQVITPATCYTAVLAAIKLSIAFACPLYCNVRMCMKCGYPVNELSISQCSQNMYSHYFDGLKSLLACQSMLPTWVHCFVISWSIVRADLRAVLCTSLYIVACTALIRQISHPTVYLLVVYQLRFHAAVNRDVESVP